MKAAALLELRARLKESIRGFFAARSYLEVDTPVAVVCPGTEAHLRYFSTAWQDIQGKSHQLWLRSSPELHMKQIVALGVPRIYQIGPCFRSGGELADWHHPEFSMLEWYRVGLAFDGLIDETEELLHATLKSLMPEVRRLGGKPLQLPKRLPRLTVADAFARFCGLELFDGDPDLGAKARARGLLSPRADDDFETAFFKVLLEGVEPRLKEFGGCVLMDYPASQAALAEVRGGVAKRFEIYVEGVELCNGFEELRDGEANRQRILANLEVRRAQGHEVPGEDQDFYRALAGGLPPCAGNALGVDRWLALVSGLGNQGIGPTLPFRNAAPYDGNG